MKAIFKIDEHLPDTKQIVVKFCKSISHKSIDDYVAKAVNYDNLDMTDAEFNARENNKRTGEDVENEREMAGQAPIVINFGITYNKLGNYYSK